MMEVLDVLLPMGILILCVYLIGYMSGSEQAREIYNPVVRKNDVKWYIFVLVMAIQEKE
mgnify:CR=1 FL=1